MWSWAIDGVEEATDWAGLVALKTSEIVRRQKSLEEQWQGLHVFHIATLGTQGDQ